MGGVQISPNIIRTKEHIDKDGNTVKPFTHEIIKKVEQPYIPTPEEVAGLAKKPVEPPKIATVVSPNNVLFTAPSKYGMWKGRTLESMTHEELCQAFTELGGLYQATLNGRL